MIHAKALVESKHIGEGTQVSAFARVLGGAQIGCHCNIGEHVLVENEVVLGDRVTVGSGVKLRDGLYVEDDVTIGPETIFCSDTAQPDLADRSLTRLRKGVSIEENATLSLGVTVGRHAVVKAGAVVASDVPAYAVVEGSPGRVVGFVGVTPMRLGDNHKLSEIDLITDDRGDLMVREAGTSLPFVPQRIWAILNVPERHIRGDHAHKELQQFLVALSGTVSVVLNDGHHKEFVVLDSPRLGLYVPPMTWCTLYNYSPGAVVIALASAPYDASDYIRDYEEFCRCVRHGPLGE